MKKWSLITEREALSLIDLNLKTPVSEDETIYVNDALERVCSLDVYSKIDVPGFKRSSVDGYAIKYEDVEEEGIKEFKLIYSAEMGRISSKGLESGECAYVPTGGSVPPNADRVIMLENVDVELREDGTYITVNDFSMSENVIAGNEDFSAHQLIARAGCILGCADIGKLSAVGFKNISVKTRPRVYIISTGDELETDSSKSIPSKGKIFNINENVIETISRKFGFEVVGSGYCNDEKSFLRAMLSDALEEADMIIFSGGSSVGEKDYVKETVESFEDSKVHFHGVRIKPGKPTLLANIGDKVILGLPGHPASTYMIYTHFGGYIAERCFGTYKRKFKVSATMTQDIYMPEDRDTLQIVELSKIDEITMARYHKGEELYEAKPLYGKSAVISKIADSHGYITLRTDGRTIRKGQRVFVQLFE